MSFIEKLDMLMAEKHINKSTLSKEAGIPYTTIDGFYKKGSENIKLSTLRKLASYFNCCLDYLVDDDNIVSNYNTIAAHKDGENFTPEELNKIEEYKRLLLAARPRNNGDD